MRKGQDIKLNMIGQISCLLMILLLGIAVCPVAGAVYADEGSDNADAGVMTTAATNSTVGITFSPSEGAASMTPVDVSGAKAKVDVKATVRVQNSGGYSVYVGSSSSDLKAGSNVIPSVTTTTTYANMPVNRWGYSWNTGETVKDEYNAMPATLRSVAIDGNESTNIKDETRTYMLSFAANIGADKPTGTYSNQVTMSVVSSPLEISDLTGLATMQEMTSEVCTASATGATAQLKDTRDGKYYWVTKLADGKCWMTQNLDLDLSTSKKLTAEDSDVPAAGWIPQYDTATTANSSTILDDNAGQRSWSLGNYRINNPTASSSCGSDKGSAADCPSQFTSYATPITANGDANAHYILGNHYQWNAATAGTGGTITSGQATNSICPKGWRLPTSNTGGEFQALITAASVGSDVAKLASSPLYFVRGGRVNQPNNSLFNYAGDYGRYWSSTPNSDPSDYAYYLAFDRTAYVDPSNKHYRANGFSVRCVARTGDEPVVQLVTYSITYGHNNSTGTLPAKQEAQSTGDSYTFTAPEKPSGLSNTGSRSFRGWSKTQMSNGSTPEYTSGSTITLTKDEPNITLYPVWGGVAGGAIS